VRCDATHISDALAQQLGYGEYRQWSYPELESGWEYVVYGLHFADRSRKYGTGVWVVVIGRHFDWLVTAPLGLFEVIDTRASRHWVFQRWDDGGVALCLPSFSRPFFEIELQDGDPETMALFRQMRQILESEFSNDLLREIIRGDRPFDALEMAGVFVKRHWSTWTFHNPWDVSTLVYRQDLAKGLLEYAGTADELELWARLVLTSDLVTLEIGDQPEDDVLLAAVWDASINGTVDADIIALARRITMESL
jgi:hypothetical protein